jgi:hypothetical protein
MSAAWDILAVDCRPLPQAHRVQTQAELLLAPASAGGYGTTGSNGTNGFTGEKGIQVSKKRMDVRGVPPRGKPV